MQSEKMFALVPSPIVVRPSVNVFAKIAKPQSVTSRAHLLATHAKQSGSSVDAELISSAPGRRAILLASVLAVTSTANPIPAFAAYGAGAGSDGEAGGGSRKPVARPVAGAAGNRPRARKQANDEAGGVSPQPRSRPCPVARAPRQNKLPSRPSCWPLGLVN